MPTETDTTQRPEPPKYVTPNHKTLEVAFSSLGQVKAFIHWKPKYDPKKQKWLKIPVQQTNDPKQHMTYEHAKETSRPIGLVCNQQHSLIALDIDGVDPTKTQELKTLMKDHPTYEEASPSGLPNRRRRLYALINPQEKLKLSPKTTHLYPEQHAELSLFNTSENYVTLTGEESNNKPIALITPDDLTFLWPSFIPKKKTSLIDHPTRNNPGLTPRTLATLTKPVDWVEIVKCDADHPLVKKFCSMGGYSFYDYWLLGLMTLHYSFGPREGYGYADTWSQQSSDYDSEELKETWDSLNSHKKYTNITEKTYQWMFHQFSIQWPVKSGKSSLPVANEYSNFQAFLQFYDLQVKVDGLTKTIYLDGPDVVLYPRFYKNHLESISILDNGLPGMIPVFMDLTRVHKFRPTNHDIKNFITLEADRVKPVNQEVRFAKMVDQTTYDPKIDLDYLSLLATDILIQTPGCTFPSPTLHASLIRKWMLSMGRTLWPNEMPKHHRGNTAEGILILSGRKGGIGKSTFGSRIFPKEWEHLHVQTKPRLSGLSEDKDYKMKTGGSLLNDYDEAERIMGSNHDADLKSELTASTDKYRVPYGVSTQTFPRRYSHMASTNDDTLNIPREGTRRYWWLNIDDVILDELAEWDKYKLWAQVKYELINAKTHKAPWLLSKEEAAELHTDLQGHRSENSWELELRDYFDFSEEGWAAKDKIVKEKNFDLSGINKSVTRYVTYNLRELMALTGPVGTKPALKQAITAILRLEAPKKYFIRNTEVVDGIIKVGGNPRYYLPIPQNYSQEDY